MSLVCRKQMGNEEITYLHFLNGSRYSPYALAAIIFLLSAAVPLVVSDSYILFLLSLSIVAAIIASGLNVTNGYLGIINLSVGGQVAVGAYACAISAMNGVPVSLAIFAAVILGAITAAVIFLIFSKLAGFFFGLATIAAAEVIRLLIRNLDDVTNGVRGLRGYPKLTDSPDTTYWVLLAGLAVVLLSISLIVRSDIGLQFRATRENYGKSLSLGIPVKRLQFLGYVISGAVISLGGAFLGLLLQYIEPNIAGLGTLVQTVLMVALGGAGTILGPVLGALAITLLPEVLRGANELRLILYGLTLIIVVLALPGGIVGAIGQKLRVRKRLENMNFRKSE
jgi:branched-chain amino acid transport system permease protein